MNIIRDQKRSKVFYDEEKDIFLKRFYPHFKNKIKYFLKLRKYPGENFNFIAQELKKLGLNTPEIVEYSHYYVIMKNIHGISLYDYLKDNYSPEIEEKFIDNVVKILENGIYSGDMAYSNFLVKDGKIFVIDLEDYKKVRFFKRGIDEAIKRLKPKVETSVYEEIKSRLKK